MSFIINDTEFDIGSATLAVNEDAGTFTLTIIGDDVTAKRISESEQHPFGWIIYPPKFYVTEAAFTTEGNRRSLLIDEDALDEYDIALYLIEHNDVYGTITISADNAVNFSGTTTINGKELPLQISCVATLK